MAKSKQSYLGAFLLNLEVAEHIKSLVPDSSKHRSQAEPLSLSSYYNKDWQPDLNHIILQLL